MASETATGRMLAIIANLEARIAKIEERDEPNVMDFPTGLSEGDLLTIDASGDLIVADGFIYLDGKVFINETVNTKQTLGLTINQGANDNEILTFKSSDVAHGITDFTETDTFVFFKKLGASSGGLMLRCFSEDVTAIRLSAFATNDDTSKSTSSNAYAEIDAYKKSGTSVIVPGADANLLAVRSDGTTRFIFDAEGSAHADIEWTTFDEHDDIAILDKLESTILAESFGGWADDNRQELERLNLAHFDEKPGHAMVNFTKLSMLLVGALRQSSKRVERLELALSSRSLLES